MNDLTTIPGDDQFSRAVRAPGPGGAVNMGAVAIESERAVAEARGQIQLAKMFPRSVTTSITEFMDACRSPEFAAAAFYSVPNRGSGPSIRFAEEAARCYGNFEYGHRELGRSAGKSEVEVYAWDKEKNNYSKRQITVEHILDSKNGPKVLRDQADIDNRIANVASKQMRGRILALLPKHMVALGQAECKKTLAGGNEKPLRDRILGIVNAFSKYGVNVGMIEKNLGHKIDDTTIDELADLIGIGNALKEGGKPSEYFPMAGDAIEGAAPAVQAITDAAAASKKTAATAGAATVSEAQPPQPRATRQASKTAESASKQMKDEAPAAGSQASQSDNNPPAESPAPAAQQAAGGEEEDVF